MYRHVKVEQIWANTPECCISKQRDQEKESREAPVKGVYLGKSLGMLCSFTVTWPHRVKNGTNGNVQQKFINSFFSISQ